MVTMGASFPVFPFNFHAISSHSYVILGLSVISTLITSSLSDRMLSSKKNKWILESNFSTMGLELNMQGLLRGWASYHCIYLGS